MEKQLLLYNILFSPKFKVTRHVLLIASLAIIAFNHIFQEFQRYSNVLGNTIHVLGLIFLGLYLVAAYFNLYVLVPRYLLKKKYVSYLLGFFFLMVLLLAGKLLVEGMGFSLMNSRLTYAQTNIYDNISYFVLNTICIAGISMTVLLKQWTEDSLRINRLESNLLQTEVDRMKEQINPGFLFDILDTTSALAKTDAGKASQMLFQLSELLRYELYDCNREKVFLNADIQFITNYLELEQMNVADFEYDLSVTGKTEHLLISPLLLIPLVQKILMTARKQHKHAISKSNFRSAELASPVRILKSERPNRFSKPVRYLLHISIVADNENIRFSCRANHIVLPSSEFSTIEQRLQILYKGTYQLSVNEDSVELQLMLSSHVQ